MNQIARARTCRSLGVSGVGKTSPFVGSTRRISTGFNIKRKTVQSPIVQVRVGMGCPNVWWSFN